jgi:hypothetical protein
MHFHRYIGIAMAFTRRNVSLARSPHAKFMLKRKRKSISMCVTATSCLEVIRLFLEHATEEKGRRFQQLKETNRCK